jgi:galactitol-specific phosphotransferase system IIB component
LKSISNYLKISGYSVSELDTDMKYNSSELDKFDAIVLSGLSEDVIGMQDTLTSAAVINAEGMSREELRTQLDNIPSRG